MKSKGIIKICVDIGMTLLLLMLMAYSLIGEDTHEWIGCIMFVLFFAHHILNINWCKNLFRGKYTAFRIVQTLLVLLMLCSMIGSMVSGIVLSRHVFAFLPIRGGSSWARTLHMVCGYWGFVIMALHLGFHWNMMMAMVKKMTKKTSTIVNYILRGMAWGIAVYGLYTMYKRQITEYLFLKIQFVFFDYNEPLIYFFLDYWAVMGMFVCVGYYISKILKR